MCSLRRTLRSHCSVPHKPLALHAGKSANKWPPCRQLSAARALLAQLLAQGLQQALLLGREAAREVHVDGDVLVAAPPALPEHWQAVPAQAQPVARLRARPHAHLLLPVQRRHPAPHAARWGPACKASCPCSWLAHMAITYSRLRPLLPYSTPLQPCRAADAPSAGNGASGHDSRVRLRRRRT